MGMSVESWDSVTGIGRFERDRYRSVIDYCDYGAERIGENQADKTLYASGSQTRMRDSETPGFHELMRLRQDRKNGLSFLKIGGPLALESVSISTPTVLHVSRPLSTSVYRYDGVYLPSVSYKGLMTNMAKGNKLQIPSDLGMDRTQLMGLGSTAISKSIPDIPDFSLPRFIGELREGLPKIPLRVLAQQKKVRTVGDEYLNAQFGLMPTISDLTTLLRLLTSKRAKQFVRENLDDSYRVRKLLDKGTATQHTDLTGTSEVNTVPTYLFKNQQVKRTRVQSYRIWSSCTFKYYQVKKLEGLINDLESQLGIGLEPNVDDLWNLLPWSWFVDWFTNVDDVCTSLSYLGRNGLYMHHGYIMGHFVDEVIDRHTSVVNGLPYESVGRALYERKYRLGASPFGFGLTWKEFNPFQTSILAALGTSKLRF